MKARSPLVTGTLVAVAAALTFGVTTPIVQRFGRGTGAFTTAACLYGGAAIASLPFAFRSTGREAPVRPSDTKRLLLVALCGALFAPVLFAWGLQRTTATSASLLLNFEAAFSIILARALLREAIDKRLLAGMVAIVAGGTLLALGAWRASALQLGGAVAVMGATLFWASDNTLSRALADRDPSQVVLWKGLAGSVVSIALGLVLTEPAPAALDALGLLACGASGYGLSLKLYLLAQRRIGASRTGSVFAIAPFVGAVVAWGMGERSPDALSIVALVLFALGVYLHASERHAHVHTHEAIEHDHAHRHDDDHHDHEHDPPFSGEHSHPHRHDARRHEHAHGPDAHHRHQHS